MIEHVGVGYTIQTTSSPRREPKHYRQIESFHSKKGHVYFQISCTKRAYVDYIIVRVKIYCNWSTNGVWLPKRCVNHQNSLMLESWLPPMCTMNPKPSLSYIHLILTVNNPGANKIYALYKFQFPHHHSRQGETRAQDAFQPQNSRRRSLARRHFRST